MNSSAGAASFAQRWAGLEATRGGLALGVAPSTKWLRRWGLDDSPAGARAFCEQLLPAVAEVAAVKAQMPFFERFGAEGLDLAAWFFAECRRSDTLGIADAKRTDAEDTMDAYADVYFGRTSGLGADAVTVLPFMGVGSVQPLCRAAAAGGQAVMVMVRTSNHQADVQTARMADQRTVSEVTADHIAACNDALAPGQSAGPVAALVGAPPEEALGLARRMPRTIVSLPGLGRPGREPEDSAALVAELGPRAMFPITSGILTAGPRRLTEAVHRWREQLRSLRDEPVRGQ